jgi:hypothetical protein
LRAAFLRDTAFFRVVFFRADDRLRAVISLPSHCAVILNTTRNIGQCDRRPSSRIELSGPGE